MLRLNTVASINRRLVIAVGSGNTFTVKRAIMPMSTTNSVGSGWATREFVGGTFPLNEFGAAYSNPNVTLPAGNYIIVFTYSFAVDVVSNAGLGIQTGTSVSPASGVNVLNAYEFGHAHQATTLTIGAAFTANTNLRVWETSINLVALATGSMRIFKLERAGEPSGEHATATVSNTYVSGWQTLKMSATNLSPIPGLTHDNVTGEWSVPAGSYLITFYGYGPVAGTRIGFQSSATAVTPTSTTNPPEVDTFVQNFISGSNSYGLNLAFFYTFATTNAFRIYGNFSGAGSNFNTARVFITRY